MLWIYILQCEDDYKYIGKTRRLYRRFWEHINGKSVNTTKHHPEEIICIYKSYIINNFIEYHTSVINNKYDYSIFLDFDDEYELDDIKNISENYITETLFIHYDKYKKKIIGGKYICDSKKYTYPSNKEYYGIPLCDCGFPCDVKKNNKKHNLYFRCAKKNIWEDFKDIFEIHGEPCNFYQEYTLDKIYRQNEINKINIRKNKIAELYKTSEWLKNIQVNNKHHFNCVGCDDGTYTEVKYFGVKRCLCFDCFVDKNDILEKIYNKNVENKCICEDCSEKVCLIDD
jgi:hypothetical protein